MRERDREKEEVRGKTRKNTRGQLPSKKQPSDKKATSRTVSVDLNLDILSSVISARPSRGSRRWRRDGEPFRAEQSERTTRHAAHFSFVRESRQTGIARHARENAPRRKRGNILARRRHSYAGRESCCCWPATGAVEKCVASEERRALLPHYSHTP